MKVISFSLWGNNPIYLKGALENIKLAKEYYPDWECRFYINKDVNMTYSEKIINAGGRIYKMINDRGPYEGMFWRFMAIDDPNVNIMISRDCDSRLNIREKVAVDEWLNSDKIFHTMHDHPQHYNVPILGGMWGSKCGLIDNIEKMIYEFNRFDKKGIDQEFLKCIIWPIVKDNCFRHVGYCNGTEQYGESHLFPYHPPIKYGGTFVGEIFDEHNKPDQKTLKKLKNEF